MKSTVNFVYENILPISYTHGLKGDAPSGPNFDFLGPMICEVLRTPKILKSKYIFMVTEVKIKK
jgi:hypothetical protein